MQFFFRICPLGGFFSSLLCAALWLLYFSIVTSGEGTAWYAYGWESQLLGKEDTSGGVLMDQGGGYTCRAYMEEPMENSRLQGLSRGYRYPL